LTGGRPICFLKVAGSGIPGVGVRPGFIPFFICSALGMPGVGVVPFGSAWAPLAGIPGTLVTGKGLPDRPGGIFAGSSFIGAALTALAAAAEFEFDGAEPHAVDKAAHANKKIRNLYINN
jgi:hypothetical protein